VGALEKIVAGWKAIEELALARLRKASDVNESLRKEIDAEMSSSKALSMQIDLLNKRLEEARAAGLSVAEMYQSALASFGGVTSPLSADASAYGVFTWLKANFAKLLEFVGSTMDFGALSYATNLCKTLGKLDCMSLA